MVQKNMEKVGLVKQISFQNKKPPAGLHIELFETTQPSVFQTRNLELIS